MTKVKICGLTRACDVELAASLGADSLGFVREPSSRRYIELEDAIQLATAFSSSAKRVLVYRECKDLLPNDFLVQAEMLDVENDLRIWTIALEPKALVRAPSIKQGAILLDTAIKGQVGGTGVMGDWGLAAEIVAVSSVPVVLAGGLTPENVAQAIEKVRPFGVDVCGGVEYEFGKKDSSKLKAFVQAVRATG